jgi:hypothetical protein
MWYFAYGSNLNPKAVAEWCRHHNVKMPNMKSGKPAVVDNYRLCFPIYSDYWGGGTADIVYDPGKYVAGVLYDLTEPEMAILDQKVGRKLDSTGREIGDYSRITVSAAPLTRGPAVQAITYQGTNPDRMHIAPTRYYMDLIIQGACEYGLSMMWVAYLQSFATQTGRGPRVPKPEHDR